jgi:hypothetical protein
VKADRGKYLAAVFTMARAFKQAGSPTPPDAEALAGFDDWSRAVRFLLMWLGMPDPVRSMESARTLDPNRAELVARVESCLKYFGTKKDFTAAEIVKLGLEVELSPAGIRGFKYKDLFDAFSKDGRGLNVKVIGRQLVRDLQRRVGDRYINMVSADAKTGHTYRVAGGDDVEPKVETDPKKEPM